MGIYSLIIKVSNNNKEIVQVNEKENANSSELLDALASYLLMTSTKKLASVNQ